MIKTTNPTELNKIADFHYERAIFWFDLGRRDLASKHIKEFNEAVKNYLFITGEDLRKDK